LVLLITRRLPDAVVARARGEFFMRTLDMQGKFNAFEVLSNLDDVDAILCTPADKFDAALIWQLPDTVRVIGTFSVGLEHIDLAAAEARGIKVCHTPDVLSIATAELALTLMLSAARRAGEGERLLRAGKWGGLSPTFHLGIGVTGKTLGILGMGRIGRELAKMARGLRMEIHYRNRSRLVPELEAEAIYHDNDNDFLGVCDFLSINVPGGEATRHWLNTERINMLKSGAVVVNTGRGTSIDDAALVAALTSKRVAAAGLDVFAEEPVIYPGYLALENVVLLPHIGSATVEARNAMGFLALQGIAAVVGTRELG
jgi:lactate dehydrogenase-like 2-hydroxyacid dehydrogenase